MKSRNIVMIVIVFMMLSGVGCVSLPQKSVAPIVTPAPHIEVAPPARSTVVRETQQLFGGLESDDPTGSAGEQQLFGGFNGNIPVVAQQDQQKVIASVYQEPTQPKPAPQVAAVHVHDLYPSPGEGWTHICRTCGAKIQKQQIAQVSPQIQPQQGTSNRLLGRGYVTDDSGEDIYTVEVEAEDISGGVKNKVTKTRRYKRHRNSTNTHGAYPEGGW